MKYLGDDIGMRDADSGEEAEVSMEQLQQELDQYRKKKT